MFGIPELPTRRHSRPGAAAVSSWSLTTQPLNQAMDCMYKLKYLKKYGKPRATPSYVDERIKKLNKQIEDCKEELKRIVEEENHKNEQWEKTRKDYEAIQCTGVKHKGFTSKKARLEELPSTNASCCLCSYPIGKPSKGVSICDCHIAHMDCAMAHMD